MASYYDLITPEQAALIAQAPLFFIATVDPQLEPGPHAIGPLNLSPKGGMPLQVVSPTRVAYLDYRGSGNETARQILAGSPVTLMVCSFEPENPAIVRLYGRAQVVPLEESALAEILLVNHNREVGLALRQVIDVTVERTATSCGYGVPVMELIRQRHHNERSRRYKDPG